MELTPTQLLMAAFVVSSALNVFMLFKVYNAVPVEALYALLDFGQRRASETPATWDDDALAMLRKAVDALYKEQTAQSKSNDYAPGS